MAVSKIMIVKEIDEEASIMMGYKKRKSRILKYIYRCLRIAIKMKTLNLWEISVVKDELA